MQKTPYAFIRRMLLYRAAMSFTEKHNPLPVVLAAKKRHFDHGDGG